jgi:hypothetical protein
MPSHLGYVQSAAGRELFERRQLRSSDPHMEHVDLLYSGLMAAALILSIWTALLVTLACYFFGPSILTPRGITSASPAATISSSKQHVSQAAAAPHPLP